MTWRANRIGPYLYEIETSAKPGMRVPARIWADDELWKQIAQDRSLDQLTNVATLPGVVRAVHAMPDVHEGYGFPVGGVAAMRADDGVISPGGVGYDINCGVRLLASELQAADLRPRLEPIVHELSRSVPSGTGRGGRTSLDARDLDDVLARGSRALVERGLATEEDLAFTESFGSLAAADPEAVSARAKQRGHDQLGTLGSGNHFLEVQVVDAIFDDEAAASFGLRAGMLTVLVHTGSRGLGHQVCTDYVRRMDAVMARLGIVIPDRELACAPLSSREGKEYFAAMCAAANFAWANRQAVAHAVRDVFRRALGDAGSLRLVWDVAHNVAKLEEHGGQRLLVHRKGATRAFGPGHPDVPARYRAVGQPVLVPGSMGTASYVLAGTSRSSELAFASSCHGAGRRMSRGAAKRATHASEVRHELAAQGIVVRCASASELAEEAPLAYKDVERVVEVVHGSGIARKVARLRPIGVVKG